MTYQQEREEFFAVMAREFPEMGTGDLVGMVRSILRDANRVQSHAVNACNGNTTPRMDAIADNAHMRICDEFAGHGHAYEIEGNGDPRGACTKVRLRTHRGNDGGGEGYYCIPTRRY